jgi:hypothetical protein
MMRTCLKEQINKIKKKVVYEEIVHWYDRFEKKSGKFIKNLKIFKHYTQNITLGNILLNNSK